MNIRAFLFTMLSSMVCFHTEAKISDCSNGQSFLKLTELSLSPDPPVRGKQLDMIVKFDNPGSDISEGSVTTSVSLNYIPFQPTTESLCTNTICPLVSGPNDRSTNSIWPDSVSGLVSSKIVWNAADSSELLCIQITAKIAASTKKSLRNDDSYNQTHSDLIANALRLNSPVGLDDFELPRLHKHSQATSGALVVWKPFLNAHHFHNASKTPDNL